METPDEKIAVEPSGNVHRGHAFHRQQLLGELAQAGPLSLFSANRPSLSEIFLTAVRQRRGEVAAARAEANAPAMEGKE